MATVSVQKTELRQVEGRTFDAFGTVTGRLNMYSVATRRWFLPGVGGFSITQRLQCRNVCSPGRPESNIHLITAGKLEKADETSQR